MLLRRRRRKLQALVVMLRGKGGGCRAGPCVGVAGPSSGLLRQADDVDPVGDPVLDLLEPGGRRAACQQLHELRAEAARLLGLDKLKGFLEHVLQHLQRGRSQPRCVAVGAAARAGRGGVEEEDVADDARAVGEVKAPLTVLPGRLRRLHYRLHHLDDRAHHLHGRSRSSVDRRCL